MWSCGIGCSMAGFFILNGACVQCPIGSYCPGDNRIIACGQNSTTTSTRSSLISQCICNPGYYGVNGLCGICPFGSYCTGSSIQSCPNNANTTTEGAVNLSQCACKSGYYGPNSSCKICPVGNYCPGGMPITIGCNPNSNTTSPGAQSINQCICNSGFYRSSGGTCLPCPENSHCTSSAFTCHVGHEINTDQTGCTACVGPNLYKPANGNTACIPCPSHAVCTLTDYQCNPGYFTPAGGPVQCAPCPPGTIQSFEGNNSTGLSVCRPCPVGMYQPESAQLKCKICPGNSTCTSTTGTIMFTCNDGYIRSTDQLACVKNPIGYTTPSVTTPSTNPSIPGNNNGSWITFWQANPALCITIIVGCWFLLTIIGFLAGYLLCQQTTIASMHQVDPTGSSNMTAPTSLNTVSRYSNQMRNTRPRSYTNPRIQNQSSIMTIGSGGSATVRRPRPISIASNTVRVAR